MTDSDRNDLTPVSEKAQALLALLATARDLKRTRSWLQDKLWSESTRERGSASLRQTLTTIRRCLGPHSNALKSTRFAIWLDQSQVEISWIKQDVSGEDVFLEGMDIRDAEFEDWLRIMRGGVLTQTVLTPAPGAAAPDDQKRWKLVLAGGLDAISPAYQVENEFINLLTRNLSENGDIDLAHEMAEDQGRNVLAVDVKTIQFEKGRVALRVSARFPATNRVFWTESAVSSYTSGPIEKSTDLLGLAFRLQTALSREMALQSNGRSTQMAPRLTLGAAIPQVFSFRRELLLKADRMLEEMLDDRNGALVLGWQAQIAVINLIEQFTDTPEACAERGKMLAAKALEADPMNSMVLTTAANAHVLLDWDTDAGSELASLAIRVNPSNPLGWWAYANVALYSNDPKKALQSAQIASRLGARSPMQFWFDFQVGLAALQCGDLQLATRSLETSAALSPQFRPPRRYLLGLYVHNGQLEKARRLFAQISELELDFSVDRYLNDPEYPISLMRRTDLIDRAAFLDLAG